MDYKQISGEQVGHIQTSADRLHGVPEIETVSLGPSVEKGALDAITDRVVCRLTHQEPKQIALDEGQVFRTFGAKRPVDPVAEGRPN